MRMSRVTPSGPRRGLSSIKLFFMCSSLFLLRWCGLGACAAPTAALRPAPAVAVASPAPEAVASAPPPLAAPSPPQEDEAPIPEVAPLCPGWAPGDRLALHVHAPLAAPRVAALTFDDGPHPSNTPKILDILAGAGAQATFFVTGTSVHDRTYALLQRMVAEGHTLANHGYFHDTALVTRRDEEGRAMIGRNLLLNQAVVDVALLARSPEDFRALYGRLVGAPWPQRARGEVLTRGWPALLASWAAILKERAAGQRPRPMIFVRLPGGAPYVGKGWHEEHVQAADQELARLGMVHVLWHSGVGDADPWRAPDERHDPARLTAALDSALRRGGIITLHDRAPVAPLRDVLRRASRVELVGLEHYIERTYGCQSAQARAALWLHHADAFDGSLCPWFCAAGEGIKKPPEGAPRGVLQGEP